MIRTWMLIAATLLASGAHATLNVSMRVHPASTLPRLPVSFSVTLTNPSTSPVTITGAVNLEVTAADGATYFAIWDRSTSTAFPTELNERLTVPPGGARELYLPLD